MSITKGAMLISNANAVGAELVNKLGGTGYKPVEWADAINLLGISNDDKASALASITEGTYTGDERGSIKYSNCNAVGSMLNKKFSTDRGFKPVEWESAISKLTPLAEGTVSGSVVSFSNGADTVPLKKCEITLPASLDGYSYVDVVQYGKNLASELLEWNTTNRVISPIFLKNGTYTVSVQRSVAPSAIYIRKGDTIRLAGDAYATKYNSTSFTFTADEDNYYYVLIYRSASSATWEDAPITEPQIEVGSTATAYEPYTAPTTHTASLGRTIYGGTADVVKGEGNEDCSTPITLSSLAWNKTSIGGHDCFYANLPDGYIGAEGIVGDCDSYDITTDGRMGTDSTIRFYNSTSFNFSRVSIRDDQYASYTGAQFKEVVTGSIVYQLAESARTDFTFDPVPIDSKLGNNTLWSEQGDMSVVYRKDPDIPDPPVQVINMNDNENNDN